MYLQEILIKFFPGSYAPFEIKSFAKMKHTIETVCQRNSSETVFGKPLLLWFRRSYCVNLQFCRKFWFLFLLASYTPFEVWNFAKIKCTTEIIFHRNYPKPHNIISWNFVQCSWSEHTVYMCIYKGNYLIFFWEKNLNFWSKYTI